jgi:hypothetical protein
VRTFLGRTVCRRLFRKRSQGVPVPARCLAKPEVDPQKRLLHDDFVSGRRSLIASAGCRRAIMPALKKVGREILEEDAVLETA